MNATLNGDPPQADSAAALTGVADPVLANPGQGPSPWRWMALACLLLGISGGVRFWRDYQFAQISTRDKGCPFPLSEFPKSLGRWKAIENSEAKLDPEIARVAGSSDHLIRSYLDSKSGEKVTILLLYGLAEQVFGHTPEVCYPASGYQGPASPKDLLIPVDGSSQSAIFRPQIFFQPRGPSGGGYQEVFYSFRHGNHWQPDMAREWKKFRSDPGMFKIQTSCDVSAAAVNPEVSRSLGESLVTEMVRALEQKLASKNRVQDVRG